jgi:hypothetical protein
MAHVRCATRALQLQRLRNMAGGHLARPNGQKGRSMAHIAHQPGPVCVEGGVSRWLAGGVVMGAGGGGGGGGPTPPPPPGRGGLFNNRG